MSDESAIRQRLGIPTDAAEVLVVAESTHWDPDWLLTSTEYLRLMVAPTLDRALDALVAEPRRVYSVECAFFPAAYLELRPERRDDFVRLANEGRLRFTGSGVTTPDTLLPEDEGLLRDLLEGARWLRSQGITVEPRSLYLPDSFGHSPGVPALLRAAGVDYAGICRIDGMRFPGAELEAADRYPWPGTSAARLVEEGTADFVWRSPDGSEVLTHWHAFSYGHGDLIGHGGFTRAMGLPLAWPSRRPDAVAARVDAYLDELRPLARTPYLLLTIGFDFSRPVTRLTELLDTWNATSYDRTGVWAVNATLEDHLDLVATHRGDLPVLDLDPNPYWTGFYATRPALKQACRDLGRELVSLDLLRARRQLAGDGPQGRPPDDRCDEARWIAATSNHHDLVTGTSPDRTARREQWPWLQRARAQVRRARTGAESADPADATTTGGTGEARAGTRVATPVDEPVGQRDGSRVTVAATHFTAVFDEAHGGTLVSLVDTRGNEVAGPRSLSCVAIAESGGLWRMGLEFPGGRWRPVDATADHPGTVTPTRSADGVSVAIDATLEGRPVQVRLELPDDAPVVGVTVTVTPRLRRTVTLAWRGPGPVDGLVMHQPGAVVTRPLQKRFDPTFWPLHSWAVTVPSGSASGGASDGRRGGGTDDEAAGGTIGGIGWATAVPTAVHVVATGTVEVVLTRTAPRELAWGVVPLLGPALGWERGPATAHLAFGPHDRARPPHHTGRHLHRHVDRAAGRSAPTWPIELDDPEVDVTTVKPADHGGGVIVRLRRWDAATGAVTIAVAPELGRPVTSAWRCDALERDIAPLDVSGGAVTVPLDAHLTTVRLDR